MLTKFSHYMLIIVLSCDYYRTGGPGQFPPPTPTGVIGYPPQFAAGGQPPLQGQIQRPPQQPQQFTNFSPGPQFPGQQLPSQHVHPPRQ